MKTAHIVFALSLAPMFACVINDSDDDGSTVTAANTGGQTTQTGDDGADDGADGSGDDGADGADSTGGDGGGSGGFCTFECGQDEDCQQDGMDVGLTCEASRCVGGEAEGCVGDDECVALLSGWSAGTACATQADCDAAMQVCLDVDGEGHCVTAPSDFVMCDALGMEDVDTTNIDGDMVTVCGRPNARCGEAGFCENPCMGDGDCMGATPVCNTDTGSCECGADVDCGTLMDSAFSTCNSGVCGCGSDADCTDSMAANGDVCNSGACGCSGDAVCEEGANPFDGATAICQSV